MPRRKVRVTSNVLWLVLGTIVVIFSVYEIVERTWLTDAPEPITHLLHIVRGVGTCIVVALLVVWYMSRMGPSIFPSEPSEGVPGREEDLLSVSPSAHFNQWLIRTRWIASIVAAVLILAVVKGLGYLQDETLGPLMLLVLCVVATNFLFQLMLRRQWLVDFLPELQIGSDLILLTMMLHFSGGIENPLILMYVFHVIISGIFLSRSKCYAIVIVASILFAGMALAEMGDFIQHYTLEIFPHGGQAEDHGRQFHASHDPVYVASIVGLQFTLLALAAHFVIVIMERLRAEQGHLREISRRLERVIQATGVGFLVLDKEMNPVWMNAQVRDWLKTPNPTRGQRSSAIDEWTGGREGTASWTLNDGKTRTSDRELVDSQGNRRFLHTTISAMRDETGQIYEVVELTQDSTERKVLEAETMNAKRLALLGTLAAGIAHEVGNPLASMSTQLRLLERNRSESYIDESLGLIQQQIDRLSLTVRDISQFARPVQNRRAICQVNTVVTEAITLMRFHRHTKDVQIEVELDKALPDTMAVKDELMQVFLNLGFNAIEAMTDGGLLSVKTYSQQDEILVEFADTGPGMSDEVRSRIFEPFFTSKEDGLGLGLSISHKIATLHGGRIEARNRPEGSGALFTVILPIRKASGDSFEGAGSEPA